MTTIIPILGAQYLANPRDVAASLTEAEKEARTIALLTKVQTMGGMVMLIPEPSNRHNPNAVLARHRGVSVGYVGDDYLEVPRMAYYSILTLLLIRELTCEKLGIPNQPLTTDDYLSDDEIQDMELMPATIGQVLLFGQTQCEMPIQRTRNIDNGKAIRAFGIANGLKKALEELKTEIQKAQSAKR